MRSFCHGPATHDGEPTESNGWDGMDPCAPSLSLSPHSPHERAVSCQVPSLPSPFWARKRGCAPKCRILHNTTFWPQMSYYRCSSRNGLFQCRMSFLYTMKIHKYEKPMSFNKYAQNVTKYGIQEIKLQDVHYCLWYMTNWVSKMLLLQTS